MHAKQQFVERKCAQEIGHSDKFCSINNFLFFFIAAYHEESVFDIMVKFGNAQSSNLYNTNLMLTLAYVTL